MNSWQLTLVVVSALVLFFQYLRARRGMPDPSDSDQREPITRLGLDRPERSPKRPPAPSPDRNMDRVSDPPSTSSARLRRPATDGRPPSLPRQLIADVFLPPPPPPPPPPHSQEEEVAEITKRDGVKTSEGQRWVAGAVIAACVLGFFLLTDWRESPERKAEAALQEIDQLAAEIAVAVGELGDIEDLVETNPLAAIATFLNPDRRCPLLRDRLRTTESVVRKIDRIEELFPVAISAARDKDEFRTGLANANEMRGRAVAVISWLELAIRYGC